MDDHLYEPNHVLNIITLEEITVIVKKSKNRIGGGIWRNTVRCDEKPTHLPGPSTSISIDFWYKYYTERVAESYYVPYL